jgi:transcriptional regulator with XRE-family HTH domain
MERSIETAVSLGREVRAARLLARVRQSDLARSCGVSQPLICDLELGLGGTVDLNTWAVVASAVGIRLEPTPALPSVRGLAGHRLIARLAERGGWASTTIEDETLLARGVDRVVVHVWDVVTTLGIAVDRITASVERERMAGHRASGVVVIPSAWGNRRRVSEQRNELSDVFPTSANVWYRCLVNAHKPMPTAPGILWAFPGYVRLRPATSRPGWVWTAVGDGPRYVSERRRQSRAVG